TVHLCPLLSLRPPHALRSFRLIGASSKQVTSRYRSAQAASARTPAPNPRSRLCDEGRPRPSPFGSFFQSLASRNSQLPKKWALARKIPVAAGDIVKRRVAIKVPNRPQGTQTALGIRRKTIDSIACRWPEGAT